jgi:hypothetical protein
VCYMPQPSHPWFNHPNSIWLSIQFMKFLIMESSPASHRFLLHTKQQVKLIFKLLDRRQEDKDSELIYFD